MKPDRALESGAWAFQLAVIGYQVTASMLLVGPTSQTALIAALAVPPTAYLVRDLRSRKWITPPSRASRAVLALSCLLQAFWLFGIIHRYAPELIRGDTPLVALGFPYLAIGLLRTDRRLGVGLLPLLFTPVSLAAALCWIWSNNRSLGLDTGFICGRSVAVLIGSVLVIVGGLLGLERLRTERLARKEALTRHALAVERAWVQRAIRSARTLDLRLWLDASGTGTPVASADAARIDGEAPAPTTAALTDVNVLLHKVQLARRRLDTLVSYDRGADLSQRYMVSAEDGRELAAVLDEIVLPEPGLVEISCVLQGTSTLVVAFTGRFANVPPGTSGRQTRAGRGLRSVRRVLTLVEPVDPQAQPTRLVRLCRRYGPYWLLGCGVAGIGLVDAVAAPIVLWVSGRQSAPALLAGAAILGVSLRRAYVAWRHPERLLEVALLLRWLAVSSVLVAIVVAALPTHQHYFGTLGRGQPYAVQIAGPCVLLALAVRGSAIKWVVSVSALTFVLLAVIDGPAGSLLRDPVLPTVLWWPYWTMVGALGALLLRHLSNQVSCMVEAEIDEECATTVAAFRLSSFSKAERQAAGWLSARLVGSERPDTNRLEASVDGSPTLPSDALRSPSDLETWVRGHAPSLATVQIEIDASRGDPGCTAERAWIARMLKLGLTARGASLSDAAVWVWITPGRVATRVWTTNESCCPPAVWEAAVSHTAALGGRLEARDGIAGSIPRLSASAS